MRIERAQHVRSAHRREDFLQDGLPQVAFVGRSNVGKSSLLNRLLGRKKLARTSSTPGRTRAIHYFLVDDAFYFVDLPGYGYAKVGKRERREWAKLMDGFFQDCSERTRAIQLVDAKVGATELDVQSFEYLASVGVDPIVVATRADRVPRSRRHRALAGIGAALGVVADGEPIAVSAKTGEGVKDVWREVRQFVSGDQRGRSDGADQGS